MFLSDRTMRLLVESGLASDRLVEILQSLREDEAAAQPVRSTNAERQARYRTKKKAEQSVTDVTIITEVTQDNARVAENNACNAPRAGELAQVVTLTSSLRSEGTQEANASFVDASKPAEPEKPKTKPPKTSRGTRLPDGWEPTDADVEVARSEGLTDEEIQRAALEFRNYWCSRTRDATKLSWPRTWHNRVLEIADRKRRGGPRLVASSAQPGGGGRGAMSFADIYVRRHGQASD